MALSEKIRMWHEQGNKIKIARTVAGGIIMPTDEFIWQLERKGFKQLAQLEEVVGAALAQFRILFHLPKKFGEDNPAMGPGDILDLMGSFVRCTHAPTVTT